MSALSPERSEVVLSAGADNIPCMLACPHCAATLTRADLFSRRLLRPRTCAACGGEYFEGGTTGGFALVGAGGSLATRIGSLLALPEWAPAALALGCAGLGVLYTTTQVPRPIRELPTQRPIAIASAVLAGLGVFALLRVVAT
jgi:ferredoxin